MSIWTYNDALADKGVIATALLAKDCVYCKTPMAVVEDDNQKVDEGPSITTGVFESRLIRCCPVCGWWTSSRERDKNFGGTTRIDRYGATACLRALSLTDQSVSIEEIRSYLAAKYDTRFHVDPWKFEETVASVYRDLGYRTRVTARSGDDGIDVVLDGPDDAPIGVQVKRYRNRIDVEQIRAFAGALYINGITRGVFVTTSSFQSGAERTVAMAGLRGTAVELVDAERFYDALGIAQRNAYQNASDPSAPYYSAAEFHLDSHQFHHGVP
ncbi:MAG TPA: restriction endonuclease [Longimicrobium sp.]|nr:restriction endonuclease [Longimicrobium sp.]